MDANKHHLNIVEQFSKQAIGYSSIVSHSSALDKLIQWSSASKEDKVLDIACGSGIVSCEFAKHCGHVTGIDLTKAMITNAKKLQAKNNLKNITWDLGDVNTLPYPDDGFSIVVSRFGFHHFLEPAKVLSEMKRVCKSKGKILVVDVSLPDSKIHHYNAMEKIRDSSHVAALSYSEFESLFEQAGFRNVAIDSYAMQISLNEQLQASFPSDPDKLKELIIHDIGINNLGINPTVDRGDTVLHYPIYIFSMTKN